MLSKLVLHWIAKPTSISKHGYYTTYQNTRQYSRVFLVHDLEIKRQQAIKDNISHHVYRK